MLLGTGIFEAYKLGEGCEHFSQHIVIGNEDRCHIASYLIDYNIFFIFVFPPCRKQTLASRQATTYAKLAKRLNTLESVSAFAYNLRYGIWPAFYNRLSHALYRDVMNLNLITA